MKATEFCYWLQGYFELAGSDSQQLNAKQVNAIRNHLSLVFIHDIDPSQGSPDHQAKLQEVHDHGLHSGDGPIMRC